MSTSAFFTSDDALERRLDCGQALTPTQEIDLVYSIAECTRWIAEHNFLSVSLQFPDNMLVDAPKVAKRIQEESPNCSVFILGDTSYGSCCADEVGAQHYKADCIIHYGSTCLSPVNRLPVFYVLGRPSLDVGECVSKICQQCSDTAMKAILAYDTKYAYIIYEVFKQLQQCLPHLILSKISLNSNDSDTQTKSYQALYSEAVDFGKDDGVLTTKLERCGRIIALPEFENVDNYNFIYIGESEGATIMNLMMSFNRCPFYAYDPLSSLCQRISMNVNKALMKRYYLIERAKDANIIGIVAGTLGVAKFRDIIEHLKDLLKKAGKKSYTFVVGKLNPQKLANFSEVEVYVLVSCPESCLFDQSDFHVPIVTPFEMDIACNKAREWTGDYITDFSTILPGSAMHIPVPDEDCYEEEGDVSLISNRLRVIGERNTMELSTSTDVVVRSEGQVALATDAAEFLSTRSWKGLEQKLGETPVVKAVEGQTGIATSYTNEKNV